MITNDYLSTIDGGVTFFRSPEWVTYQGVRHRVVDMANRGEFLQLASSDPNTFREWKEPGTAWLGYNDPILATNPDNGADPVQVAAIYLAGTAQSRADAQRADLKRQIDSQIPNYSSTETLIDDGKNRDVMRASGAASDKQIELQDTADQDLDAFDPTLAVAEPQADVGYSRFTASIAEVTPWGSAPNDNLGFVSSLYTEEGLEAEGAEGRLYVVEGADAGAVLPFAQDDTDARLWTVESRDGFKWSDPEQGIKVHLLWGAGSLQVSPTLHCERKYDRKAVGVRYGVASGAGRSTGW